MPDEISVIAHDIAGIKLLTYSGNTVGNDAQL